MRLAPEDAAEIFAEPIGELLLAEQAIQLIVIDVAAQEILRWIP